MASERLSTPDWTYLTVYHLSRSKPIPWATSYVRERRSCRAHLERDFAAVGVVELPEESILARIRRNLLLTRRLHGQRLLSRCHCGRRSIPVLSGSLYCVQANAGFPTDHLPTYSAVLQQPSGRAFAEQNLHEPHRNRIDDNIGVVRVTGFSHGE